LWRRSAAPTTPGLAHLPRPGLPNADLRFAPFDGDEPPDLPVPVLEIAPRWLSDWASLVAGAGPRPVACATFPAAPPAAPVQREHRLPVAERVRRFLAAASPGAAELAAHAAVAVPSLPVLRLIQHRVLGRTGPSQLAEVLLSGLLRPVDDHYEFVDGAREALLAALPRPEALHTRNVLNAISAEITRRAGTAAETFPALLDAENGDRLLPADGRTFAFLSPEAQTFLDRRARPSRAPAPPDPLTLNGVTAPDAFPAAWERRPRQPVIGLDHEGRPLVLDPLAAQGAGPHGVVFGAPEDRSALVRSIVLALAASYSPADLGIMLGGLNPRPLGSDIDLPHLLRSGPRPVFRPEELDRFAAQLTAELDRRSSPPRRGDGDPAALLVVLDRPLTAATETAALSSALVRVAEEGARLGVHLLLSTDAIDHGEPWSRIVGRLPWRIAASPLPPPAAERLFGRPDLPGVLGNGHACLGTGDGRLLPFRAAGRPSRADLASLAARMRTHTASSAASGIAPPHLPDLLAPPFPASWDAGQPPVPLGVAADGSPVRLPFGPGGTRRYGGAIHGGPRDERLRMLRTAVMGLALTHRPGPLRFVFADTSARGAFAGLGGLPHVALAVHAGRPDSPSMDRLAATLADELEARSAAPGPFDTLLVVVDDAGPLLRAHPRLRAVLSRIADEGPPREMHLVLCSEDSPERVVPAIAGELAWRVEVGDDGHGTLSGPGGPERFRRAEIPLDAALQLAEEMNRLGGRVPQLPWPPTAEASGSPDLLAMMGPLPIRWPADEPGPLPPPLLGRDESGAEVRLAGFPGSGTIRGGRQVARRHMLRTILFGLALAHSPRGVNFVLVDTSERAFAGLERLPHIVEAAYGLSAGSPRAERLRSVLSLELQQRALPSSAAPPHLVIALDDAAALTADPDLRDLLLRIARTGAGRGVHLILSGEGGPPPEFAASLSWVIDVDTGVPYHDELRLPDGTLTRFERAYVSSSECAPLIAEMNRRDLRGPEGTPTLGAMLGLADEVTLPAELAGLRETGSGVSPVGRDGVGNVVGPDTYQHGLVVGADGVRLATLRALLLGQLLMHPPDRLGIVLVGTRQEAFSPLTALDRVIRIDPRTHDAASVRSSFARMHLETPERLLVVVDESTVRPPEWPPLSELLDGRTAKGAGPARVTVVMGARSADGFPVEVVGRVRWRIDLHGVPGRGLLRAADTPPLDFDALRDDPPETEALVRRLAAHDAPAWPSRAPVPTLTALNGHTAGDDFLDSWVTSGSPVIGVDTEGRTVALDPFAERAHGLVVGNDADRREVVSSLVLALALNRSPDDQIVFAGGLGEHPLGRHARLPHVEEAVQGLLDFSGVLLPDFLGRITAELEERAQLLREAGAGSWAEYREQRGGLRAPMLLVVVDLSTTPPGEPHALLDVLVRVAQQGADLGVCLVVGVAEMNGHPEWSRLLPSLRWSIIVGPPYTDPRAQGREPAAPPGGEPSAFLMRPDGSGPYLYLRPAQPSGAELDDLAARMDEHVRRPRLLSPEDEHAQADVPDMLELNLRDGLEEPALALLGVDRAGDAVGVPITPYRGQRIYGQVNGPGRARRHLMRKILLGTAVALSPSEVVFVQLGIPARLSGQASPAPHVALAEPDWSDAAWERFSGAVRAELDRREALLRDSGHGSWGELRAATGEADPSLVVAVHLPDASVSPLEIRALLDRTVDASGRLGVFLLLSAPHPYSPLEAPLSWRIGAGEREAVLHDITGESVLFQIARWPDSDELAGRFGRPAPPVFPDVPSPPQPVPAGNAGPDGEAGEPVPEVVSRFRIGTAEGSGESVEVDFGAEPHLLVVGPEAARPHRVLETLIDALLVGNEHVPDAIEVGVLDPRWKLRDHAFRLWENMGVTHAEGPQEIADVVRDFGQRAHDRLPVVPDSEHAAPQIPDQSGPDLFLFVADQQLLPDVLDVLDPMIGREIWSRLHLVVAREPSPSGTVLGSGVERLHWIGTPALFLAGSGGAEAESWQVTPPVGEGRAVLVRDGGQRAVRLRGDG
ncbi:hypothetical protein ACSNOI_21230, partial [Actinomadura kijaniata]